MRRTPGFTVIEVMVAITIAGIVIVAVHQLFTGVADGARALVGAREALDHEANASRWLKATFLSLEPPFDGRTNHAAFTTWQLTSSGWFEPLAVELRQTDSEFVASVDGHRLSLANGVTAVAFDYLLEPGAHTRWVREWVSSVSAPLAVRIRIAGCGRGDRECADTLLFLIKERG